MSFQWEEVQNTWTVFVRYFEVEVVTPGYMRVGWARINADPSIELGYGANSYGFDGYLVRRFSSGFHSELKCFYFSWCKWRTRRCDVIYVIDTRLWFIAVCCVCSLKVPLSGISGLSFDYTLLFLLLFFCLLLCLFLSCLFLRNGPFTYLNLFPANSSVLFVKR